MKWLSFWLGGSNTISLNGLDLEVRGGRYFSKIADLAMAWEVAIDEVYDHYPIQSGDTILDIGGHIGSFSKRASLKAFPGRVHTCEPFPPTFDVLSRNTMQQENITVYQVGISDIDGEDTFYYSPANPAENSLVRKTEHSTKVSLLTLNSFLEKNKIEFVDLLKIDCEGAEYSLIFAAGDCLHKIDKMVMEIHEPRFFDIDDKYSIEGLVEFLQTQGFEVLFERENKFQGYIYAHQKKAV